MTNYDMLVDAMSQVLYDDVYDKPWDEKSARKASRKLLQLVEKFQNTKYQRWRATD